jgi:hypothetical protein
MSDVNRNSDEWIDYDYAIVRAAPRVDHCTFLNVGVVLHARRSGFLDVRFGYDRERLRLLCSAIDPEMLDRFIDAYRRVCLGGAEGGPVGMLPQSERFHWLTAPRSAVIQTSRVHPGRCHDPAEALDALFNEYCQPSGI